MAKPTVQPTPGYILIEPTQTQKQTSSGIYLPDSHDEKSQQGKVLAIGADTKDAKCPVKKNDTVIYKKWGGDEVKLSITDKELVFVKFEDVLATVK
jgi:chaperonin GroES